MSELVVYGNIISQPSRSVEFFLKASGIAYTFVALFPLKGQCSTEEYTKVNPFQTIPAIVHNGYNLWESAAIITYLADAFDVDNQWYPKDPKVRGRINAYLHWHHQNVRDPLISYLRAKRLNALTGRPELTEEAEAPHKERLNTWYENIEWQISETGFAGRTEKATIADVFLYNEITLGLLIPLDLGAHPKLQTYFDTIGSDPILQELLNGCLEALRPYLG